MANGIIYDPNLNLSAGYLDIKDDEVNGAMTAIDRKSLVHLLFWALYTFEGRELMRKNKPVAGVLGPNERANLLAAFAKFNVTGHDLVEAILDAHIAAEKYAIAFKDQSDPNRESVMAFNEGVYMQKMSFICWELWENSKVHEFSLGW